MKVALLSFAYGEYCVRLANGLAKEAQVLLLLPRRLAEPHLPSLDEAVGREFFHKPRLRQPLWQVRMIWGIVRRIRGYNPDLIHLQQGHLWFNLALPLLRRYPLVVTIHDPRHHVGDREARKTPQMAMDLAHRRADQVIVHGGVLKQAVVDRLGIPEARVQVIPMMAVGDGGAQADVQEDGNLVLFFGRIWEYKGLEYLIRAEPLIAAEVPEARIMIAGRGEDLRHYRAMMVHPERFVVRNEYVPDDQVAELFRRASVVVLPYSEATQSGIIPMAYAYGRPVVATKVGALPELVEDGRTGYLVPPRDERALAEAIVRLLRDKGLRERLGANGRRKMEAECSTGVVAQKTLAVYRRAIGAVGQRPRDGSS